MDLRAVVESLPEKIITEKFRGYSISQVKALGKDKPVGFCYMGWKFEMELYDEANRLLRVNAERPEHMPVTHLPTPNRARELLGLSRRVQGELGLDSTKVGRAVESVGRGIIVSDNENLGVVIPNPLVVQHEIKERKNYNPDTVFRAVWDVSMRPLIYLAQKYH